MQPELKMSNPAVAGQEGLKWEPSDNVRPFWAFPRQKANEGAGHEAGHVSSVPKSNTVSDAAGTPGSARRQSRETAICPCLAHLLITTEVPSSLRAPERIESIPTAAITQCDRSRQNSISTV